LNLHFVPFYQEVIRRWRLASFFFVAQPTEQLSFATAPVNSCRVFTSLETLHG